MVDPYLADDVKSDDDNNVSSKFNLRGVMHHTGDTLISGHYIADSKRLIKDGEESDSTEIEQWIEYNDHIGRKNSIKDVTDTNDKKKSCYIALYSRDDLENAEKVQSEKHSVTKKKKTVAEESSDSKKTTVEKKKAAPKKKAVPKKKATPKKKAVPKKNRASKKAAPKKKKICICGLTEEEHENGGVFYDMTCTECKVEYHVTRDCTDMSEKVARRNRNWVCWTCLDE